MPQHTVESVEVGVDFNIALRRAITALTQFAVFGASKAASEADRAVALGMIEDTAKEFEQNVAELWPGEEYVPCGADLTSGAAGDKRSDGVHYY